MNERVMPSGNIKLAINKFGINSNTLATWWKEPTHRKRPWHWEKLRAGGEGGNRGWDGWMASPTQQTRVWASSGSWWRTGKPGVLQSKRWQRVEHDWETELNWLPYMQKSCFLKILSQNLNFFPLHTFISKYLDKGMNE